MGLQPLLHDLLVAATAPTQAWSSADGQIRSRGAEGCYHGDTRVLSAAVLTVGGREPEMIAGGAGPSGVVECIALLRGVDEPGADPTVRLRRRRTVRPGSVHEALTLTCATAGPLRVVVSVALASDGSAMDQVKAGGAQPAEPAMPRPDGLWWPTVAHGVGVTAPGAFVDLGDPCAPVLRWELDLTPGVETEATWALEVAPTDAVVGPPAHERSWSVPQVSCDDRRLVALLDRSLVDLASLRMTATFAPDEVFLAAGAPWFFTLFGRDSLWAARMMLPLGTELAAGTLRTLAARQGTVNDPHTAEQPGKILHEVRAASLDLGEDDRVLPPTYYGTVDATPLFVCLLHDAWRWGMAEDQVRDLLPAMEAALAWMAEHGDADGDGFLEYLDESGSGLVNQGWKDSGDSVQWRDGTLAVGPIALCEVQGYAHEAALSGAALLEAFGRPGAERWRAWAARLATAFRQRFWVVDDVGGYPAIALDAAKRPVDSLTSNIGHLLGTGLLDPAEEDLVAARLAGIDLDSGYGLRTLSSTSGGYWPLRYHGGSVWTHDTAITIAGLARTGRAAQAAPLIEGLLAAADGFGYRLPELHSGDARGQVPAVVPYPAACRPQAWAAASAVVLLSSVLGIVPDAPNGAVRLRPPVPSPVGALVATGLRFAGGALDVAIDAQGRVTVVSQVPAHG